jgi:hypothetical protein
MTVKYPDITLLLQGPCDAEHNREFVKHLDYYKTLFSEIVLSTYAEHVPVCYEFLNELTRNSVKIIYQSLNIGDLRNDCNFAYQTLTTANGLAAVKTKYVIKHRTDERYSNLDKLVDKFLLDDEKWVCGTTYVTQKSSWWYHPGDHLVMAKTEKLKKTFDLSLQNLKNGCFILANTGYIAAEITYATNFIIISGENPSYDEHHDRLMLKYFDIINDRHLYPFLIRVNTIGKVYDTIESLIDRPYDHFRFEYENMEDLLKY